MHSPPGGMRSMSQNSILSANPDKEYRAAVGRDSAKQRPSHPSWMDPSGYICKYVLCMHVAAR